MIDRNNDISRCNKVMLERMTHIMRETGNTYGNDHEIVAKHLRNVAFRREMKRQRQHEKIQSENQVFQKKLYSNTSAHLGIYLDHVKSLGRKETCIQ